MNPKLHWDGKFLVMKKIIESIAKINNTEIKSYLMHMHFNAYLVKKEIFWVWNNWAQRATRYNYKKIHEIIIAKNLRLGSNFPRASLYSRKNSVGIGLINPKTALSMLTWKFCIGNWR